MPGIAVLAALIAATPQSRREENATFVVDAAFQHAGGVQLSFQLISPDADRAPLKPFLALDRDAHLSKFTEPVHVTVLRLSYEVEKDVSFFTKERLINLKYMQALAPQLDITSRPGGGFHVGRVPGNSMTIEVRDEATTELAHGAPVVVQTNFDFARVMGWRTAAWSTTWTFHESLGPGRTRITVLALNYLYNLPPPMLGGAERLFLDTRAQSLELVAALRAY